MDAVTNADDRPVSTGRGRTQHGHQEDCIRRMVSGQRVRRDRATGHTYLGTLGNQYIQ